jgi:hypothetical protein
MVPVDWFEIGMSQTEILSNKVRPADPFVRGRLSSKKTVDLWE